MRLDLLTKCILESLVRASLFFVFLSQRAGNDSRDMFQNKDAFKYAS